MFMIHWCEICNQAPSDGILEVIRTGEYEKSYLQACNDCVANLNDSDWIGNELLELPLEY